MFSASPCTNGYHDVTDEVAEPEDPTPEVPDPGETTDPEEPGETTDPETPDPGETTEPEEPDTGKNNNGNGNDNGNDGNHSGWYKDGSAPAEGKITESGSEPAEEGTLEASLVLAATSGGNGNNGNQGNGNGNKDKPTGSDIKKTSTVVKQFVVDFSREDYKPLMEQEVNGLTYRYVNSDKARLSVVVQGIENGSSSLLDSRGELHAYYHTDYLGTTDYLTSAVNSKVIAWTSYNEWGEITHNAVLKCGQRELDLVKEYATHDYDAVLDLYYAKARFYDAYNRTFTAQDPILDPSQYDLREYVKEPMALVQYLYVRDNAVNWIDPSGDIAIPAAIKAAEGIATAAVGAVAIYIASPSGQETLNKLAQAIGMELQEFSSTADDIFERVGDATDYFYQISCDIVENVQSIVDTAIETGEVNKNYENHTVYVHYDTSTGKIYYVGRTNNFARRYSEHSRVIFGIHTSSHPIGPDVGREMIPVVTGLNFLQSKIVEQVLISAFSLDALDNARNEFSKKRWDDAIAEVGRALEILDSNVGLEGIL